MPVPLQFPAGLKPCNGRCDGRCDGWDGGRTGNKLSDIVLPETGNTHCLTSVKLGRSAQGMVSSGT